MTEYFDELTCLSLHKVNDSLCILGILTCKVVKTFSAFVYYTVILRFERKKIWFIFFKQKSGRKDIKRVYVFVCLVLFISSWRYINLSIHNFLKPQDTFDSI